MIKIILSNGTNEITLHDTESFAYMFPGNQTLGSKNVEDAAKLGHFTLVEFPTNLYELPPSTLNLQRGALDNGSELFAEFYDDKPLVINYNFVGLTVSNGGAILSTLNLVNDVFKQGGLLDVTVVFDYETGSAIAREFKTKAAKTSENAPTTGTIALTLLNQGLFYLNDPSAYSVPSGTSEITIVSEYDDLPVKIIASGGGLIGLKNSATFQECYTEQTYASDVIIDANDLTATSGEDDLVEDQTFKGSWLFLSKGSNKISRTAKDDGSNSYIFEVPNAFRSVF